MMGSLIKKAFMLSFGALLAFGAPANSMAHGNDKPCCCCKAKDAGNSGQCCCGKTNRHSSPREKGRAGDCHCTIQGAGDEKEQAQVLSPNPLASEWLGLIVRISDDVVKSPENKITQYLHSPPYVNFPRLTIPLLI